MAQLTKPQIRRLDDMVATRMARLARTETEAAALTGDELIAYAELTEIRATFEAMLLAEINAELDGEEAELREIQKTLTAMAD